MRGTSSSTGSITWSLPPVATCSATPSGDDHRSPHCLLRSHATHLRTHTCINEALAWQSSSVLCACLRQRDTGSWQNQRAFLPTHPHCSKFCMHAHMHATSRPAQNEAARVRASGACLDHDARPAQQQRLQEDPEDVVQEAEREQHARDLPRHHPSHPAGMSVTDYVPPTGCSAAGPRARKTAAFSMAPPTSSSRPAPSA